jgi:hypothetical protein
LTKSLKEQNSNPAEIGRDAEESTFAANSPADAAKSEDAGVPERIPPTLPQPANTLQMQGASVMGDTRSGA